MHGWRFDLEIQSGTDALGITFIVGGKHDRIMPGGRPHVAGVGMVAQDHTIAKIPNARRSAPIDQRSKILAKPGRDICIRGVDPDSQGTRYRSRVVLIAAYGGWMRPRVTINVVELDAKYVV